MAPSPVPVGFVVRIPVGFIVRILVGLLAVVDVNEVMDRQKYALQADISLRVGFCVIGPFYPPVRRYKSKAAQFLH